MMWRTSLSTAAAVGKTPVSLVFSEISSKISVVNVTHISVPSEEPRKYQRNHLQLRSNRSKPYCLPRSVVLSTRVGCTLRRYFSALLQ